MRWSSLTLKDPSNSQTLTQPDQLQAIFGIFAIIFGVNPSVSIAAL